MHAILRNVLGGLALSAISGLMLACSGDQSSDPKRPPSDEVSQAGTFVIQGELERSFASVEEIVPASDVIAVVVIQSSYSEVYEGVPFTMSEAVVREPIFGEFRQGDTMTIAEVGGPIAGRNKANSEQTGEVRFATADGVPPMSTGETYLVFLVGPTRVGPTMSGVYTPQGVFQGKVRLEDSHRLKFTGPRVLLSEPGFELSKSLDGRMWEEVKSQIRAYVGSTD